MDRHGNISSAIFTQQQIYILFILSLVGIQIQRKNVVLLCPVYYFSDSYNYSLRSSLFKTVAVIHLNAHIHTHSTPKNYCVSDPADKFLYISVP